MIEIIDQILSILTIAANIIVVVCLLIWLNTKLGFSDKYLSKIKNFLKGKELQLGFWTALIATCGSLFYSEIAGYTPCKLCWFQRIFMYTQVFIFGLALIEKDKNIFNYNILLSVVGGLIALYHYIIQFKSDPLVPCSTVGYSASCSDHFTLTYGYITIPMMALSAFALIIVAMLFLYKRQQEEGGWFNFDFLS
jgi:disulfide bond formation protein DsbB